MKCQLKMKKKGLLVSPWTNIFSNFMEDEQAIDLGFSDFPFTRNNKRKCIQNIKQRIDKVLTSHIGSNFEMLMLGTYILEPLIMLPFF